MNKLLKKLADARSFDYALPREKLLPLDTPDFIKASSLAFERQIENLSPSQALVAARTICDRAREQGVAIESSLAYKYASSHLSPHFVAAVNLRREATAHLHDPELDKLLKVASIFETKSDIKERVKGLDKVAWALEGFDREHDLEGHWNHFFPDPAYTVYGLTLDRGEEVEFAVKVAEDYVVRRQDIDGADWSLLEGKVPTEVVEGLQQADDKLAVFASLPDPEKEIIYQTLWS